MLLFTIATIGILTSCKTSNNAAFLKQIKNDPGSVVAWWNEDTVNNYQVVLTKDKKFFYTIKRTDSLKVSEEYYLGTFRDEGDKLYLEYKDRQPFDLKNYLIKEASGNYLIQYFTNDRKRIFLRSQVPLFRHR